MFFHKTPFFLPWIYPGLTWKKQETEKNIYLTFDDGPIPGLTEFILDTLNQYEIKATFFCVGHNIDKHHEIAVRTLAEGHRLGNHSFNHVNGWQTSTIDYISNVVRCQRRLVELESPDPQLFRPPYGKIKRLQIHQLRPKYEIIMWDVLTGDFLKDISPEQCLRNSIKATSRGSIILFHDNVKAEKNVKYALPRYIEHFLEQGYKFKTL